MESEQKSLYEEVVAAGIKYGNHCSDLYIPDTAETRAMLARHPLQQGNARRFVVQKEHPDGGQIWWDVPFAYLPYWEKRMKGARGA